MTLLAGIFSRQPNVPVQDSACEALRRGISRFPEEQVVVFRDPRVCLLKVDVGAFGQPAYRVNPSGTAAMLAGDPLLQREREENIGGRAVDLELLHRAWDEGDWSILGQVRGAFCAVYYRPQPASLSLIADKLAIRPLYYWSTEHDFVFASSLRVLETLRYVLRKMDVRAVTEIISFGYPLGDRTPYSAVFALRPAEVVHVSEHGVSPRQYWRWDEIPVSDRPEPELLTDLHCRFTAAVARRLKRDTTASAFLSGGLDSRCIVATLCSLEARVYTLNFAPEGSQDQVFGAEFAKKVGTTHQEKEIDLKEPRFFEIVAQTWKTSPQFAEWPEGGPRLVWSGDGGSVGLGHVYLTPEVVTHLRLRRIDAAIEQFLHERKTRVAEKLLRPEKVAALAGILHEGIRDELSGLYCQDPGRGFHVFLMLNDQRRHLASFYENIDLHRFDCHLPFYDSDFLEGVMAIPLDSCLRHRFYTKLLALFQPAVTSVPWQTYPGHEPCTVPIRHELSYQWNTADVFAKRKQRKAILLRESHEILGRRDFPEPILNKWNLRLARWAYRLGLRDYGYVLEAALTYQRYWTACAGNYMWPVSK